MLVEIKERKTTHSKGKLLINWQSVCCTESHSLINRISLVQTLFSTNAGSKKIEEQEVFEDTGFRDICLYLYLQCGLKHTNQHILTSKNTIAHFIYIYIYIRLFTPKTASGYPVQTPTPLNIHMHIRFDGWGNRWQIAVSTLMDDIIWPMCWSCMPKSWVSFFLLALFTIDFPSLLCFLSHWI